MNSKKEKELINGRFDLLPTKRLFYPLLKKMGRIKRPIVYEFKYDGLLEPWVLCQHPAT